MHRRIGSAVDAVFVAVVAAVIIIGGITSGCSRSSDASATPEITAGSTPVTTEVVDTTSTSVMTDEEAILAAVSGYWDAYLAASNPPDPNHPAINEVMTGDARDRVVNLIAERRTLGQAVRLPNPTQFAPYPTITDITENSATVSVCLVDDSQLVAIATGEILNEELATLLFTYVIKADGGVWKVSQSTLVDKWEGRAGCAPEEP